MLAAAIIGQAPIIVTFNLSDFPSQVLAMYNVQAVHPDDFAAGLYRADPLQFVQLVKRHRVALVNPPKTVEEYLATLAQCGLYKTVTLLQPHQAEI